MAEIAESLCTGCKSCVYKCPFKAIKIINTPKNMAKYSEVTHRYGAN